MRSFPRLESKHLSPFIVLVLVLVLWQLGVYAFSISELIIPPPFAVAKTLLQRIPYLAYHGLITLTEAVLGLLAGGAIAVGLAVLFEFSRTLERAVFPYAIAIKAIPLVALAPIVVLWFGTELTSKIVLAAIISFFPILVNVTQGLRSVDPEALDLFATFSASRKQVLTKLRIPGALPSLFAGMKISSTFAVVGAVVAEFVGAKGGIGYVVKSSSYYTETALTFAAIIVASCCSLALFSSVAILERWVLFWRLDTAD